MTSYEGLYLTTNRQDEGREVLRTSAATVSEGMLANTADTGSLEYNTVDGTLWFVHALGRHLAVTGDTTLGRELAPVLAEIVQHHIDGTRYGIAVDPADGLLRQGADGLALTWMDARIDGVPVTPRAGKPVEVNALWLRALEVAAAYADPDRAQRWTALRARGVVAFRSRFVRDDGGGLLDVVDGPSGDDGSVRPNQLLAVSLGVLDGDLARPVRPAVPARASRRTGRARCRLPPGDGLAVADRPLRRRGTRDRRPGRRRARRPRGASRRVGPRLDLGDRRRLGAARGDRLPVPGVVGRRDVARPPARAQRRRRAGGRAPARTREQLAHDATSMRCRKLSVDGTK